MGTGAETTGVRRGNQEKIIGGKKKEIVVRNQKQRVGKYQEK